MNKDTLLAFAAMTAFALNSLFCRFALGNQAIDPVSFTLVRLLSGAVMLVGLGWMIKGSSNEKDTAQQLTLHQSLALGLSLFGYALLFSFAYIALDAGTGALILFGTVQLALIAYHRVQGNRVSNVEMMGIAIAVCGFVLLLLPGAARPSLTGSGLMVVSGLCWSIFTVLGKSVTSPIIATKQGFVVASGFVSVAFIIAFVMTDLPLIMTAQGIMYGLLSGVLASALGYFLWYSLLPKIDVLEASMLQLTVPVIAMFLGWLFIEEAISFTSLVATGLILGGIGLVSWFKLKHKSP